MMSKIIFKELKEFQDEFNKLEKKFKSLKNDFKELKAFLELSSIGKDKNIVRIVDLGENIKIPIYKIRKFACECIKNNSSFRLVYAYKEQTKEIEFIEIEFIEIFHKNKKENHNIKRIEKYYILRKD